MSLSSRSRSALGGLRARLARRRLALGRPVRLRRREDLPYEDPQYFAATGARFLRSLKRHNVSRAHVSDGPPIGVVIMPWVRTPVPWYATMLALGLERRGRQVILLWDDTEFPREASEQNRVIRRVLRHLGRFPPGHPPQRPDPPLVRRPRCRRRCRRTAGRTERDLVAAGRAAGTARRELGRWHPNRAHRTTPADSSCPRSARRRVPRPPGRRLWQQRAVLPRGSRARHPRRHVRRRPRCGAALRRRRGGPERRPRPGVLRSLRGARVM